MTIEGKKEMFYFSTRPTEPCEQVKVFFEQGSNKIKHVEVAPYNLESATSEVANHSDLRNVKKKKCP